MLFTELALSGAFSISPERHEDSRGWFARTFCRDEFSANGLASEFVQCSTSFNAHRGTLRGMHFQRAPHEERKLVRCTRGAVLDVLLDVRPGSSTHGQWLTIELTGDNGLAVYIPGGLAHGFQTLTDCSEIFYQMAERYDPATAHGIRWDDPTFRIDWPLLPPILSDKDATYSDFCPPVTSAGSESNVQ